MASNIVIVESPAKAKTINKYLGSNYKVIASYGHIRDLAEEDGSVKPDDDFHMSWEIQDRAGKHVNEIAAAVKSADRLILATDPDREGEAISWHLLEVLKEKKALKGVAVERVVFNAITKAAVTEAMANPRQIDNELVDAYLARRALDYLVGYNLSPILWRKLPGARSAGRVQSVALRLVCEREMEIERFRSEEYWSVDVALKTPSNDTFTARLIKLNGEKLEKFSLPNEVTAHAAADAIRAARFSVTSVESKPARRNPYPPFTTSTLQQEAARKLGFSASHTMRIAQRLYEGVDIGGETVGLITYMRTDGVDVAPEALTATRKLISSRFSERHLPSAPRLYKSKTRNAQEAHEAIRPTDVERLPDSLRDLEPDMARLYDLIWKRLVASQMEAAEFERTTVEIESGDQRIGLRANGSILTFEGFLALYQEGRDEPSDDDDATRLPKITKGDALNAADVKPEQHFTEPPPRFSEASLVKKLEELGIGRPSTYASILQVLRDRKYVRMDKNRFIAEDKGLLVTAFLTNFFQHYVEYDFTASLEERLDLVSDGKLKWKVLLAEFWRDFHAAITGIGDLRITQVLDTLNEVLGSHIFPQTEEGVDPRKCKQCKAGTLGLRLGRFGAFIGCSNYASEGEDKCSYTRQLASSGNGEAVETRTLGIDPDSGQSVTLRAGRFGPYLQLGETSTEKGADKPKRSSIPKGVDRATLTLEQALRLLSLPREVGIHPESGKPIVANFGRFGPYVNHDGAYANLESDEEVFTIGLNRAVTVLAEKAANPRRRFNEPKALKELGPHPETQALVKIMSGRYGAYVTDGTTNATLPKGADPQTYAMEAAVVLLKEREMAGGSKKKKPAKKAAKEKVEKPAAKSSKATAAEKSKTTTKEKPKAPAPKKPAAKKKVLEKT